MANYPKDIARELLDEDAPKMPERDVIERAMRAYLMRGVTDPVASQEGAMRDAIRVVLEDARNYQVQPPCPEGRWLIESYARSIGIDLETKAGQHVAAAIRARGEPAEGDET